MPCPNGNTNHSPCHDSSTAWSSPYRSRTPSPGHSTDRHLLFASILTFCMDYMHEACASLGCSVICPHLPYLDTTSEVRQACREHCKTKNY